MTNYFYFNQTNTRQGPVDEQQLQDLAAQDIIAPDTRMETDTGHTGVAGQIPGLFPSLSAYPAFNAVGDAGMPPCNPVLHLICSVLMTSCCCMPLGVVGIVFSALSMSDLGANRYESAVKNSTIAMWCNIVGLIAGAVIAGLYILFWVIVGFTGGFD